MQKDAYYFSHDSNARLDDKIIALRMKHGWEGYGLFWALIEKLRDNSDYSCIKDYNLIAFDLRTESQKIKSIIEDFDLFEFDENIFYSRSLTARMSPRDEAKKSASINGIIGNLVKNKYAKKDDLLKLTDEEIIAINQEFKNKKKQTPPPDRNPTAKKREEKKEEESKREEKKEEENPGFSSSSTQQILISKQISVDQWAMMFKVPKERIHECIKEFSEFKFRHNENTWKNETDLTKNFEFWLRSNAVPKPVKSQPQNLNHGSFQKAKRR